MGLDGIEQVVYYLLKKYPQLDASRIYAEGLSAGSLTATALGIKKSYLFAAVGGHSGGIFPNRNLFGYSDISLMNDAKQKRGKVEMPYFSVSGTDDEVVPYPKPNNWKETSFYVAWRTYQTMNGMPVVDNLDFTKDSCFGIGVKDRKTILTNKDISIEMGTLYKGTIPMIQLVAVDHYGHWNFKPDAELMWAYFTLFSRDVESKELKYSPQ
jgi:poly(3-hydroxybutyrate) depolymerase